MIKIGITGGIGSGKTFICHILEKLGYPVFYSDQEAKKLMNENLDLIIKIKELKAGVQNDTPRNDGENIPEKYFIENKDILFAWSASIGAYLWCSGKSILNQHIFNVKPLDKDLHNWLYFSLLEKIPITPEKLIASNERRFSAFSELGDIFKNKLAFAIHLHLYWGNEKVSLGLPFCLYLLPGLCKRA